MTSLGSEFSSDCPFSPPSNICKTFTYEIIWSKHRLRFCYLKLLYKQKMKQWWWRQWFKFAINIFSCVRKPSKLLVLVTARPHIKAHLVCGIISEKQVEATIKIDALQKVARYIREQFHLHSTDSLDSQHNELDGFFNESYFLTWLLLIDALIELPQGSNELISLLNIFWPLGRM